MGNFNRDDRSGGRPNFGRRGFDQRGSDRPSMHKATCSKCGSECEVPFFPSSGKPVYCSKCFEGNRGSDSRRFEGRNSDRPRFGDRQMYEAICDKCGNKARLPFQPKSDKPVYCSKCFEDIDNKGSRNTPQYKEQFEILNSKLDKILKILSPVIITETVPEKIIAKDKKIPEVIKKPDIKIKKKKTAVKKATPAKPEVI